VRTGDIDAPPAPARVGIWGCPIAAVPPAVDAFRVRFRAGHPPSPLTGWRHFAAILALACVATSVSFWMARGAAWWEWAALPAGFLIANFVEWLAHSRPMHHLWRPLAIMYEKHTLEHHRFFTHESMEAESDKDFDMVLFSPGSLAFFLLGTGLPVAALFFGFVSWNAGWLFVALAVDYYALYECFHLAYHLPEDSAVGRLPGMARLRRHHTHHHDETLMAHWNFNVNFPVFDAVMGTHWELARGRSPRGRRER